MARLVVRTAINNILASYPAEWWDVAGCWKMHLALKAVFPTATGHYNCDHVLTEIGGWYYGIEDGRVILQTRLPDDGYEPLAWWGQGFILRRLRWALGLEASELD